MLENMDTRGCKGIFQCYLELPQEIAMVKRRPLMDAVDDPISLKIQSFNKDLNKSSSQSFSKIIISVSSMLVGAVIGVLLNRYLKLF
jgi:hypothetical protein